MGTKTGVGAVSGIGRGDDGHGLGVVAGVTPGVGNGVGKPYDIVDMLLKMFI